MVQLSVLFVLLIVAADLCSGYGAKGHSIIGDVAQEFLSANAKAGVAKYLTGTQTFASRSNVADDYRSNGGAWTATMHYVNLPRTATSYSASRDCPNLCVVSAVSNYTSRLAKNSPTGNGEPSALDFLIHFVGDEHQPLHVGYADDSGGNGATVTYFGRSTNLHSVWDSAILDQFLGSNTWQSLANSIKNQLKANTTLYNSYAKDLSTSVWANESFNIVKTTVYDYTSNALSTAYQNKNWPILYQRIIAASVRLAATLNSVYA